MALTVMDRDRELALISRVTALGWRLEHTGGNCTAYVWDSKEMGMTMVMTMLGDPSVPNSRDRAMIGLYPYDDGNWSSDYAYAWFTVRWPEWSMLKPKEMFRAGLRDAARRTAIAKGQGAAWRRDMFAQPYVTMQHA